MPFKTKVVPDWKIQKEGGWGKSYPKATYPEREKQEIKLFDIKAYVDKKRESKLNEMMNSFNPMGAISGGMNKPNTNQKNINNDSFDIDSLVKRIDAKIAELEEQEKQEQLKDKKEIKQEPKNDKNNVEKNTKLSNEIISKENTAIKENNSISNSNSKDLSNNIEPKIELQDSENKIVNGITDDEFFDDFFNDDE